MDGLTKEDMEIIGAEGLERLRIAPHDALLILHNHRTGKTRRIWGRNLVTNDGDRFYAEKACGETPTNVFANLFLATAGPATPAKDDDWSDFTEHGAESEKAPTATYPKTNCQDADNIGAGVDVVTWKYEYSTGDGPFVDVTHSFISVAASSSGPILNSYKWASSWSKDASTSAKVFANHEMLGS